ncbi:thiamine-phosphate kinase [uncultured Shewanella sp.]|uniref:thiamine-phosphate kinase n=1 Tax=uncultured Shewanella sp. TaxID=173975 RepID=UPI00262AFCEE|nr:thiamine-phosphate kinase [uncultured Shewanella sp.]
MKEFQLIERFFTSRSSPRRDVSLGIGDDCALVEATENKSIAISCDMLVEGVHFYKDIPAHALGYKSLAVNLSDLAAMGAEPAWMTLAITLPEVDESWLGEFSDGLFEAAQYYGVSLIGGDTTRGPRSICITINGKVSKDQALTRSGARNGDWIYVTGTLGDSALGLAILQGKITANAVDEAYLIKRHYYPTPRVLAGQSLRQLATSAIDLSDGLVSDLKHVIKASHVGAVIDVDALPLSAALQNVVSLDDALSYALTGGEDYELLFTVPESQKGALETSLAQAGVTFSKVGQITTGEQLTLQRNGQDFETTHYGFEHF